VVEEPADIAKALQRAADNHQHFREEQQGADHIRYQRVETTLWPDVPAGTAALSGVIRRRWGHRYLNLPQAEGRLDDLHLVSVHASTL
jgi:hypothetical protein